MESMRYDVYARINELRIEESELLKLVIEDRSKRVGAAIDLYKVQTEMQQLRKELNP